MSALKFSFIKRCFVKKSSSIRPYAQFLLALLLVLLVACQSKKHSPVATVAVSLPTPLPAGEKILSKNRRFVYLVRWYAPEATTALLDTVTLTASGAPWAYDSTQTGIEWLYQADTLWTSGYSEHVGAVESKEEFWLHPPRYGRYRILELNPFPHIKLPAVSGRAWAWKVYPPELYADSAWASWKGILHVKFHYTLGGIVQLATPLGNLPCYRVQATGTSKLGTTALESYFHPRYGFVRLDYRNIDCSRVQLEMVAVDVRPESNEKVFEQMFLQPYSLQKTL